MNDSTKKWLFLKYSSAMLIPLMIWFSLNLSSIYDSEYIDVVKFFSNKSSKILFSLFVIIAFFFSTLSISEIFEDYINDEKIKNAANKALNFSAIIIPIFTITVIFNL